MNLCPKGHNKDVVGTTNGRCNDCKRAGNRAYYHNNKAKAQAREKKRRVKCTHPGACGWAYNRAGAVYCHAQRKFVAKTVNTRRYTITDGLESEYGPIPPKVSGRIWIDWVAIHRHQTGHPVGRTLTSGEARAIHLLRVLREDHDVREEAEELVSA